MSKYGDAILNNTRGITHQYGGTFSAPYQAAAPQASPARSPSLWSRISHIGSAVGNTLIAPERTVATGVARAFGAGNTPGMEAGRNSLASGQSALVEALKSPKVSKKEKSKLITVLNNMYNPSEAAANTKQVQSDTNKRKFTAAAYETGLQPALLGNLAGAAGAAKVGVTAAQGVAGGALSAAQADKFTPEELAKQAAIGAAIPLVGHTLGMAGSKLVTALGHDSGVNNLLTSSVLQSLGRTTAQSIKKEANAGKNLATAARGVKPTEVMAQVATTAPSATLVSREVPAFTNEVEKTLNNAKMATTGSTAKDSLKEINGLFTLGKDTKPVQQDLRASLGKLGSDVNQVRRSEADVTKFFNNQRPEENLKFIQKVESGLPQNSAKLDEHAAIFRKQLDEDHALAQTLKPDLPYMENYFPQSGIWDNQKEANKFFATPTLGGKPGALEQRVFPTVYDGIKAGLKLRETNPAVIAVNSRAALLKAKMAQDFIEEQTNKGTDPAMIKAVLDRYLSPGINNATYKTAKQATYALNNLQLGLSGFHLTGTALNSVFSNFGNAVRALSTGHPGLAAKNLATAPFAPVMDVLQGKGLRAAEAAGDMSNKYVKLAHEANFPLYRNMDYSTTGLAKSLQQIKTGSAVKGIAMAPARAFSSIAKPLMEHWVPAIKAGAFKNGVDVELARLGPNASKAEVRAAVQKVADSIDNRFGELTQSNIFWNNKLKDVSSLLMRSPGWNIGTVREVGGGAANLLKPGTYKALAKGEGLSGSTSYTLGLGAGTAMIGTALSYLYTGKPPQDAIDYFYPKTGKIDKNGNEERIGLPTYAKDIFAFTHNPLQTIGNKLNPLLTPIKGLATNKDYFGNEVRNPTDSAGTQLKQTGEFLAKSALPFSVTGGNKRAEQSLNTRAQSFLGLNPAPGYITKSSFQQSVEAALNHALGSKSLTPEEQQALSDKSKQPKEGTQLGRELSYLMKVDRPTAARILQKANKQDISKLGDLSKLIDAMNKTLNSRNKRTKQSTIDASRQLIDILNKYR